MYEFIQKFHSGWAYLALLLLVVVVINSVLAWLEEGFTGKDRKIALFGLIATHIQLLINIVFCFSAWFCFSWTNV
jgi:phage-related holin